MVNQRDEWLFEDYDDPVRRLVGRDGVLLQRVFPEPTRRALVRAYVAQASFRLRTAWCVLRTGHDGRDLD